MVRLQVERNISGKIVLDDVYIRAEDIKKFYRETCKDIIKYFIVAGNEYPFRITEDSYYKLMKYYEEG